MAAGARLEGVTTFDALPPLRLRTRSPRVYAIRRVLSYLHSAAGIHELERRFSAYEPSASAGVVIINDSLVIVPVTKRDINGMLGPEYSPLESQISFPVEKRSGMETLEVICRAVTTASGRMVLVSS